MHITATEVVNTQWSAPLNECVCVSVRARFVMAQTS